MTAVSAARCTSGLALNAMPSPAAASMSRSLAPSPIATVAACGDPGLGGERGAAPAALPARSTTGPTIRPVSRPSTTSSSFAAAKSMPRSAAIRSVTGVKPPRDDREPVAQPLEGADQRAGARGRARSRRTPGRGRMRRAPRAARPARAATARSRARRASRRSVTRGDLAYAAGVGGEHLDHLALHQRRVDVHHDQPHAAAQQVGRLDGDVDRLLRRPPRPASTRSRSGSAPETCRSIAVTG